MSKSVFNKKILPYCKYCKKGKLCKNSDLVVCLKKGVTNKNNSCSSFKYDPLKREPSHILISKNYTDNDFKL